MAKTGRNNKVNKVTRTVAPVVSVPTVRTRPPASFLGGMGLGKGNGGPNNAPRTQQRTPVPQPPTTFRSHPVAAHPTSTVRDPLTTTHPVARTRPPAVPTPPTKAVVREPATGTHPTVRERGNDLPTASHPIARTRAPVVATHPTSTVREPLTAPKPGNGVVREPVRAVHPSTSTSPKSIVAMGVAERPVMMPIRATFPGYVPGTSSVPSPLSPTPVPIGSVRPYVRPSPLRLSEL